MRPPCDEEAPQPCYNGCFFSPFLASNSDNSHNILESRVKVIGSTHDLEAATSSTLEPHTQFTSHEALPSLHDSYINFTKAYPPFCNTFEVDRIRDQEYHHLNLSNACFDYTGYGLFSYAQEQRSCSTTSTDSSSSCPPPPSLPHSTLEPPFYDVSYKPVSLHSQILYGGQESELESRIRRRIMAFMNMSEADYSLVFTANEVSAFKLVADSFQFQPNGELLTVYDHCSDALDVMIESCKEQGVHILSGEFSRPNLGIRCGKLNKMIMSRRGKRKGGLFVFPPQSRVTGAPYSYIWMSMAQEIGWHVLVDACALGPKEMDSLALTMFKPDFLVCSFYKVFGEDPSGFGCLLVKKSSISALKDSGNPTSIGIISLFPASRQPQQFVMANEETEPKAEDDSEVYVKQKEALSSEIVEVTSLESAQSRRRLGGVNGSFEIECRGLDHADSMGLRLTSCRARYLINWLVHALMSLQHPHPQSGLPLIKIYGPKINSHRGPAVAFNVFDWKGEKIDPALVQKLADRNSISLSSAFLRNIRFSDKNEEERQRALETRGCEVKGFGQPGRTQCLDSGIPVVTAALGFLTNFEDTYRLWTFLSRFLDADFVNKERWRYMALNQTTIDI